MTVIDDESDADILQFSTFQDCFARRIIAQSRPSSQILSTDGDDFDEFFTSYLSAEC